jgi:hypothetical protein
MNFQVSIDLQGTVVRCRFVVGLSGKQFVSFNESALVARSNHWVAAFVDVVEETVLLRPLGQGHMMVVTDNMPC